MRGGGFVVSALNDEECARSGQHRGYGRTRAAVRDLVLAHVQAMPSGDIDEGGVQRSAAQAGRLAGWCGRRS